ncbi:MAG TPA: ABC transporter transmembrane domain-containing protein, partial [Candidatus Cybelea sp.]|nr:ABC transporter transmembrane domain-containing protein [Candidatus Cybelea sp.]
MMEVYNRVLPTQSAPTLYTLTGLAIALIMVIALLEVIRSRILVRVSSKLDQQLNDRVLSAIFAGTLLAHPKASAQGLRDLDNVRQFLSGNGTLVFFDAPWAPILIAVVYLFHPVLGMVTALGAAALLLLAAFNEIATRRPLGDANSLSTRIFGLISSSLRNAEALHAMGMFQNLQRHRMRQRNEMMRLQAVASDRAGLLSAISKAFRQVLQIAVLAVGAYLALKNEVTTGEIVAASIIAGRALAPLELAIGSWKQFVSARGAYERLRGLLEA